jgi:hypothetical protein
MDTCDNSMIDATWWPKQPGKVHILELGSPERMEVFGSVMNSSGQHIWKTSESELMKLSQKLTLHYKWTWIRWLREYALPFCPKDQLTFESAGSLFNINMCVIPRLMRIWDRYMLYAR